MILLTLTDLEKILTTIRDYAERYRLNKPALEAMEERWLKFLELALAFGVDLKPAEGVEFYAGGPLPDNTDFIKRIDKLISTVKKLKEVYGDLKVIVDLDFSIKKTIIKI